MTQFHADQLGRRYHIENKPANREQGSERRGGRPSLGEDLKQCTAKMPYRHVELFRKLGDGNISDGIRQAAELAAAHLRETSP